MQHMGVVRDVLRVMLWLAWPREKLGSMSPVSVKIVDFDTVEENSCIVRGYYHIFRRA